MKMPQLLYNAVKCCKMTVLSTISVSEGVKVYHHEIQYTNIFLGGKYIEKVFLSH